MRAISEMRRRTRLRATAVCPYRGVTIPIRDRPAPEATKNASTKRPRRRRPRRIVPWISRFVRSLAARGKRRPAYLRSPLPAASLAAERVTDGESPPTLATAARQRRPPRLRLHAGTEPVIANPLPVRRLAVCGLPHRASSVVVRSPFPTRSALRSLGEGQARKSRPGVEHCQSGLHLPQHPGPAFARFEHARHPPRRDGRHRCRRGPAHPTPSV